MTGMWSMKESVTIHGYKITFLVKRTFFLFIYRSTVDLQCLSISAAQQSDSVLYTHIYIYIYLILFHYGLLWWELQATFKYTIVLLTLVTMVYVTSPSLFYNWKFAPFEPIHPFLLPAPPSYPPSFWQPPMDSLYEILVCFCFLDTHINVTIQYLSFPVCLISCCSEWQNPLFIYLRWAVKNYSFTSSYTGS